MYYVQDAHSFWAWIYFVVLIVIGSFFMMNLCLVIISAQFSVTKKRETERMLAEQQRLSLSSPNITTEPQQGSCWTVMISAIAAKVNQSRSESRCSPLTKFRMLIGNLVASPHFDRLILVAIIINTCSMAIEHHGQPQWLTDVLEHTNYVFVTIFTIEMVLELIAWGFVGYAIIVIVSWIEIFGTSTSGLSVLRTFRLLRALKMMQFLPTLRKQFVRSDVESVSMLHELFIDS